eukprot:7469219-Pyramimonas_sp.AAC.1
MLWRSLYRDIAGKDPARRVAVSAKVRRGSPDGPDEDPSTASQRGSGGKETPAPKAACTHALLKSMLSQHFLLSKMHSDHLEKLVDACSRVEAAKGHILVEQASSST